jgi:dipeptidyl aminopeptidase/acylaminoacyl peptidase
MVSGRLAVSLVVLALVQVGNVSQASAQGFRSSRPVEGVYKDRITPHWLAGNTRFWYRNDLAGKTKEFILVDAERGMREPAFDHGRLAAALSKAAGAECKGDQLPFDVIEYAARPSDRGRDARDTQGQGDPKRDLSRLGTHDALATNEQVRFTVHQTTWACDLASYVCTKTDLGPIQAPAGQAEGTSRSGRRGQGGGRDRGPSADSPDGKWTAFVKDDDKEHSKERNVFVRGKGDDQEVRLSTDGAEGNAYGMLSWAPDSKTLVAWRIEPGDGKEVYLIESSPKEGGRAKFNKRPYALPGDKFKTYELNLFDIETRKQIKPAVDKLELDWEVPHLHWTVSGSPWRGRPALGRQGQDGLETQGQDALATRGCYLAYEKVDRGHQRFRVVEVDSHTGQARNLIDEKTETFIWTAHTENLDLRLVNWLDKSDEILYVSERDGWRHLYLVDAAKGEVRNQITKGEWVVRGIDLIDEDARQVWFHACGKNTNEDPYFVHYYRVNFDGSGLVTLTEGNGTHSIQYSPDRRYLIDTYSRVDMAPVHELRRVSDGKLVCPLEKADIRELVAGGWTPPEVFVAKGRDGKTDIWGIMARPKDFDPSKKYPVVENIYAGPQGSYVPKRFSPVRQFASPADLGFIVVQMDGMGTANRSKAFHDVCWKNLKDAGFPDRILWHQAVARKYAYYDISRVGVYGNSAGGQSAAGAVLFHPELYQAAVASCGCHDNRMDKASWNEQWMGYPVGPCYSECSNIDNAARLRGKLFLIVGEMDNNVPPESTMRLVDALVKADKDFDLLVIPGAGHGMGGAYGQHRMQDFFVRHLLGTEPPNRNGADKG